MLFCLPSFVRLCIELDPEVNKVVNTWNPMYVNIIMMVITSLFFRKLEN